VWPGQESRARICRIVSLMQLAPDIQEGILFLGCSEPDRGALYLRQVRPDRCGARLEPAEAAFMACYEQPAPEVNSSLLPGGWNYLLNLMLPAPSAYHRTART
jgi:hypothetical protein